MKTATEANTRAKPAAQARKSGKRAPRAIREPGAPGRISRNEELAAVWGSRRMDRLNEFIKSEYCGRLTIRELATIALVDGYSFPDGLDTALCVGDFEGNFCTGVLSATLGGPKSDHLCITCDPHGGM